MSKLQQMLPAERAFLEAVSDKLESSMRGQLREDIDLACGQRNADFLSFDLNGYDRSAYAGHKNLPYEGALEDAEGGLISLLVNIDPNGRLLELEYIWWENSNAIEPNWATLSIVPQPNSVDHLGDG